MSADRIAAVLSLVLFVGIPAAVVGMMLLQRRVRRRRRAEREIGGYGDDGSGTWTAGAANGLNGGFGGG